MTITDPDFYRSPAEAIAAPAEKLTYGRLRLGWRALDALPVLDFDERSGDWPRRP